jgi:hypothetical protein
VVQKKECIGEGKAQEDETGEKDAEGKVKHRISETESMLRGR